MSETSPRLDLPYIQPSQAQKHVTHNESLQRLDALVQMTVLALATNTPPPTPAPGDIHALGPTPTGSWAGHAGELAFWEGLSWVFLPPQEGWCCYDLATGALYSFNGAAWQPVIPEFQNLPGVGIGTTSDTTNRLAVSAPATLLSHAGAGHQLKLNKAGVAETASLLFQSDWTGHAEMGLSGSTTFSVKVSADGSLWHQALTIDPVVQSISLAPAGTPGATLTDTALQLNVPLTGSAVQSGALDVTAGRLLTTEAFGLGSTSATVPGNNLNNITATGNYKISSGVIAGSILPAYATNSGSNLWHFQFNASNASQLLVSHPTGRLAVRINDGGQWQPWRPLFDHSNLLGQTS